MSTISDLIKIGENIVERYKNDIEKGSVLSDWKKECITSCNQLLDELNQDQIRKEKLADMTGYIKEKYLNSKPPAIPFWCREIEGYLKNHQ